MTKQQQSERAKFTAQLRETLKPGDKLYTVLRSVSRSGMSRVIDVYRFVPEADGTIRKEWLSYWIAKACGFTFSDKSPEGIKIGGCGSDMGFEIVYTLGRVLFPDGFAPSSRGIRPIDGKTVNVNIGRGRNAGPMRKEEMDELTAKGWTFIGGRNGDTSGWNNDGGYALAHEWL